MKKRLLPLLLALILAVGLAVPAMAEGDITDKALSIEGGKYALDAPASGTGWSYDGNYTVTLSGYSDPDGAINFNNPDRQVNLVLASGTTSEASFYIMYAYGSNRARTLNVSGTGTLNTFGLNNDNLIFSEATVYADYVNAIDTFTMNSGTIYTPDLTLNAAGTTLNGGSIVLDRAPSIAEAVENGWTSFWNEYDYCPITVTAGSLEEADALIRQFRGADGQPLTAKQKPGPYLEDEYYACNADGTPAEYAVFGGAPTQPQPEVNTAYATRYSILVDGQAVAFDAYALKDENGNDTNYLKLRDVAYVLSGTQAQFDVGWDGGANAISIATGAVYASPNGSEMSTPFSGDQPYTENKAAVLVDGVEAGLEAITITDADGNGYTYFKLRDLGAALGFNVTWDADAGAIVIDTTQDYQG